MIHATSHLLYLDFMVSFVDDRRLLREVIIFRHFPIFVELNFLKQSPIRIRTPGKKFTTRRDGG
jgi:hypothetical protein